MAVVKTFTKKDNHWLPIQVEVSLIQGRPKLEFIGLADSAIKESEWRLRSAFKSQGFQFPSSMKTIINLRPTYLKKNSSGVDLAIALAILLETKQIPQVIGNAFVYGELGLDANVYSPEDIEELVELPKKEAFLLCGEDQVPLGIPYWSLGNLGEIREEIIVQEPMRSLDWCRPNVEDILLNKEQANLLKWICLGNLSCLTAGPQGSGKTTLLKEVYKLLKMPNAEEAKDIRKWQTYFNCKSQWRPFVDPHHSTTPLSIIGGGAKAYPGEITRAHHGVFLLDELLEFSPNVLESLREVISNQEITVTRVGKRLRYPADILILATTNLCKCGKYTPTKLNSCRCTPRTLRQYLDRLSGPIIDRFQLLVFTDTWYKNRIYSLKDLALEVTELHEKLQLPNISKLNTKNLQQLEHESAQLFLMEISEQLSMRRLLALKQLAYLLARLEERKLFTDKDLHNAYQLSIGNFDRLLLQSL